MIIFYFSDSKKILINLIGFSPVSVISGKFVVDGQIICTTTENISWKYIADQVLEQDENGYVHDADYYATVEPLPNAESRLTAIEMYLLEQELGL